MSQIKRIWVIESGEYSQRGVSGVATSIEAAVRLLKERHAEYYAEHPEYADRPYAQARWSEAIEDHPIPGRVHWPHWTISNGDTEYTISQYDFMNDSEANS